MDYAQVYGQFIEDRQSVQAGLVIFERHHIVPRCLGGGDEPENLVKLSLQDHLFAHILLAKMHGGLLSVCVIRMVGMDKYSGRRSRRQYQQFREQHRVLLSEQMLRRPVTDETRQKLRVQRSTAEYRQNQSVTRRDHFLNPENRQRASEAAVRRWSDPEERRKQSERAHKQWGY